jgi:predicted Zn-dependent protease
VAPEDYDSAYGLGACALYQNQPQRAVEHFRRALAAAPDSAAARLALGDALLRANQPADAVAELKKAVGLEPTMRQAYTLLARAYHRLGQTQAAREALRKEQELARAKSEAVVKTLATDDLIAPLETPPAQSEPPSPER